MYLKRLEIIGFKSFASRTILEFPKPEKGDFSITSIVGPNGSGKSNLVEAIRWALGEQSVKSLRGKKAQDIIFSGSFQKTRLNLAEVSLLFNNEDCSAAIDYKEFIITRRIFRNGESDYLINKSKVRLQDILILLAKCNFGQKSYSIVSQGLVDQILQSSPLERKKFFDEATGIRQYQIKKEEAIRKIDKSEENLNQIKIALSEITPRLSSLTKQINKLEKRQEIENELYQKQKRYYSQSWQDLKEQFSHYQEKIIKEEEKKKIIKEKLEKNQKESETIAYEKIDNQYQKFQNDLQQILLQKNRYFTEKSVLESKIILEKEKEQKEKEKPEINVENPEKIFLELKTISQEQEILLKQINDFSRLQNLEKIKQIAENILKRIKNCLNNFHIIQEKVETNVFSLELIKKLEKSKKELEEKIKESDFKLNQINEEINQSNNQEQKKREKMLDAQKEIQREQSNFNEINYQINEIRINLARVETKKEILEKEIKEELKSKSDEILNLSNYEFENKIEYDQDVEIIRKLKYQLELIGGIDPEIIKEYPIVHQRHEFLNSQSNDLILGLKSLNKIIKELEDKVKNQFKNNFYQINQEFDRYFKIIFGGGNAKVSLQEKQEIEDVFSEEIEILATPPGKKIKNIEMLSGGEKALTSLALICAIISINRPPFVVLDEVDAALDQENSYRFAKILSELRKNSQFIVITHNQETVETADILYGITMGGEGISKLVSLKLAK